LGQRRFKIREKLEEMAVPRETEAPFFFVGAEFCGGGQDEVANRGWDKESHQVVDSAKEHCVE
jgi:hypothetical protein